MLRVIKMKNRQEVLSSILKTTQMGQIGIRSVLDMDMDSDLRKAMESQLREYDIIETEAHSIAKKRNWQIPELNPAVRFMSDRMTRMKLSYGEKESKIAAMMINGNTKGVIKGLKNLHQMSEPDEAITALSNKLLETESANVHQMKAFL